MYYVVSPTSVSRHVSFASDCVVSVFCWVHGERLRVLLRFAFPSSLDGGGVEYAGRDRCDVVG